MIHTPEMSGSGQIGRCIHCGLMPTAEGHDGCLGTLPEDVVMNACCGHGNDRQAYVQYWDGSDVRGPAAIKLQKHLKDQSMSNIKRSKQAFDLDLRVEKIIDMASEVANTNGRFTDAMQEFVEDGFELRNRHESMIPIYDKLTLEGDDDDDILMALENWGPELLGICLQVATPVKRRQGEGLVFSWGYYQIKWVYGETYQEAWDQAVAWVESLESKEE